MRWREEVTLTGYEMQWTVRYFSHMREKWSIPPELSSPASEKQTGTGTGSFHTPDTSSTTSLGTGTIVPRLSAGAIAYWNRKQEVWRKITIQADKTFRICNPGYESPL
jgi:hypothetical protein